MLCDALSQEVTERLAAVEDENVRIMQQIGDFQSMLRQQGNPILAYTLERVQAVLQTNFSTARQHLTAILHPEKRTYS
jgi:hypothetical protein